MSEFSANVRDWIGREQIRDDQITAAPLAAMSATLDRDDAEPRDGDALPPLWHWLFFLPRPLARDIGTDGHPTLGGFLPPVGMPRRMWAGSRITFEHAPRVGEPVQRVSRIVDITEKMGAAGRLVFVTVQHEICTPRGVAIHETHDIVYRDAPTSGQAPRVASALPPTDVGVAEFSRVITPDPVLLFRYSALTFNGHRIHYDQPYATGVEGYPGLVVHGPLVATLLIDLLRRERPDAVVRTFRFKAQRPLFDTAPFTVNGRADSATQFSLWAAGPSGQIAVQATATIA